MMYKTIISIAAASFIGLNGLALAHDRDLGDNPDLYGSPLLEHQATSKGGAGEKGEGDLYGSHIANPAEVAPNPDARPQPIDARNALHEQNPEGYDFAQMK